MSSSSHIRVYGTDPRVQNPKVHELHTSAKLFYADAHRLQAQASAGMFVLYMHAIELALKSVLHDRGKSLEELSRQPYGHDLVRLLADAKTAGFVFPESDTEEVVSRMNEYTQRARIRYEFDFEMPGVVDVDRVVASIVKVTAPQLPT